MSERNLTIAFGALVPKLAEQLAEFPGVLSEDVAHWQQDADAITRLAIRGLVSTAIAEKARDRLFRMIQRSVRETLQETG